MKTFLKNLDATVVGLTALVAVITSVSTLFGFPIIKSDNYAPVTLLLLAAIGVHLVVGHFLGDDFQQDTIQLLEKLDREASSLAVHMFKDSAEIESHLARAVLQAKTSVCDLSWKNRISAGFSASGRQLSHGYMDRCIAEASDRIAYREIFVFNDNRRVEKLQRRLSEQKKGYSCRYFPKDNAIPRLQFVLIDDQEVLFFASAADSPLCSITSPEVCKVFRSYYEALWAAALPIKEGPTVYQTQIDRILASVERNKPPKTSEN